MARTRLIKGKNDLATKYPELVKEWDYEKNGDLLPSDVLPFQKDIKPWWICEKGHHYEAAIAKRVKGQSCPYCKNKKILIGFNDLATTHPKIAAEWDYEENKKDPNTPDTPEEVVFGANKKVHWKCEKGHKWTTTVIHRTSEKGKGPTGCPRCAAITKNKIRTQEAAKNNNLAENYPHLAEQWHPTKNGDLKASDVSCQCNKRVWWKCDTCGNEWQTTVNHRTRDAKSGFGCPRCAKTGSSFPERIIYYYIHKVFKNAILRDKETLGVELDIYIPEIKTAIEFDGYVWHNNEKAIERELNKNTLCKEKNIRLIRIRDGRLPKIHDVETIIMKDYKEKYLNQSIIQLFQLLNIENIDIDVERDYYKALAQFKSYIKKHSLEKFHPELLDEWDYEENTVRPDQVLCYRREKYYWKCKKCGYIWQTDIGHRISGRGCPKCAGKIKNI